MKINDEPENTNNYSEEFKIWLISNSYENIPEFQDKIGFQKVNHSESDELIKLREEVWCKCNEFLKNLKTN